MTEALSSLGAVLFVFALLGGLVWLSKRQNLLLRPGSQSKRIVVEEQARISPQWNIMVIRIDGVVYHVGVSPTVLQVLHQGPKS